MNNLIEKIYAFLNDLFEDDIDEETKVEIRENAGETGIDIPNSDQPSLSGTSASENTSASNFMIVAPRFQASAGSPAFTHVRARNVSRSHLCSLATWGSSKPRCQPRSRISNPHFLRDSNYRQITLPYRR